ncbi:chemotaxis protein CheA [Shewanella baltica]|uniref:chemotaxis protein CheA n=1 Tax=Shewanella baltica TaxID=62322 RepID=UPI0001E10F61|nr:chemotaxis protein CheA [Shewanella baltica]AEG10727.1 CheA signal transduction histidine kinase [Shewanella baltica BA175]EHQ15736.1 CheA signal transduction histidine kinase [Shewanella baltica OS183]MCS6233546.1 chemotaxis protein CheA [Shewanella baltica]MCS6258136.1 chemotaxis protein CheA [Shewanella baltica]MCS6268130.1 chemotaxis protein CheA [Shewanella baltica]
MAFDVDEEILQDFLIEAGEILELLQEQLVALENNPDDTNLLNAIFRGFHTVKGGAGFLSLTPMVDVCHEAENTFDLLRTGKRSVNAELMDIILQAVDAINTMFAQTQRGEQQDPAESGLLARLKMLSSGAPLPSEVASAEVVEVVEPEPVVEAIVETPVPQDIPAEISNSSSSSIDDINDAEFEALLDALHGSGKGPAAATAVASEPVVAKPAASVKAPSASGDDITDDEFEALLDELHGSGKFKAEEEVPAKPKVASAPTPQPIVDADEITDDEFERLLDELHGKNAAPAKTEVKAPTASVTPASTAAPKVATPVPVKAAAPAPVPVVAAKPKVDIAVVEKAPAKASSANVPQGETTVRVDTARLDQIMNMVGELVLVRNRLVSLGISRDDEEMSKALANLDLVTADLQGAVMKTRMQPIKKVFGRFPRVVRDLARTLNKEIDLIMVGEETDLDKNLVEALADPLVHLVRNSVDHGIEMPNEREANGKPRTGTITLSASQEGDHILLKIEDDGAGMDPEKLKKIAITRGVLDEDSASRMTDSEAYNLIFAPGFSTKVEISDISGRGVGMDVVKTRITQLNGTVHIDSMKGKGTILEIKVPLTLAIMPTLMVDVAKQVFALPLSSVNEIFHLDLTKTNIVDGQLTVIVRNKAVPLFYLEHWLHRNKTTFKHGDKKHGHVVIVQLGMMQIGFVVDALIGQEEVVIKPLGAMLHGTPGMAGATITSDGGIALILDVPGLLKHYAKSKN